MPWKRGNRWRESDWSVEGGQGCYLCGWAGQVALLMWHLRRYWMKWVWWQFPYLCFQSWSIWEHHHLWVLLSSRRFSYWAVMKVYDQVINRRRELMLMRSTLFLLCLWLIKQSPKGNTFSKWTKQREKLLPAEDLNYNCTSCCGAELNLHWNRTMIPMS